MSEKQNHRQSQTTYFIPQVLIIALLLLLYHLAGVNNPIVWASLTYLCFAIGLRFALTIPYRKGFQYYKKENYEKALFAFDKSSQFFQSYPWLDQYRYLIMLNTNDMPYLELSLVNMAFCYDQLGEYQKAKETYIKALSYFPESIFIKNSLKLMKEMGKI